MTIEATRTVKNELRDLIELLPEAEAADALDHVRWLVGDEDELTEEELVEARAGFEEIRRGDYVTLDEVERRLVE